MKTRFRVTGMTCAACAARVENVTKKVAGVTDVEVNTTASMDPVRVGKHGRGASGRR